MKKERMLGDRCHVKLEFEIAKEENTGYGQNRLYAWGSKISNITCSLMIMIALYPRSSIYKCYFNGKWSLRSKRIDKFFFIEIWVIFYSNQCEFTQLSTSNIDDI